MIKALLLDLDGTLLDDHSAMMDGSREFYSAHRNTLKNESFEGFLKRWRSLSGKHWARFMSGELSFAGQRRERIREVLGLALSDDDADEAFNPFLRSYEDAWRCYQDVAEFMQQTKGLEKIAVTNGQRVQQRYKMERTGLLVDIPDLVTPEDAGSWKPEAGIFQYALGQLGVAPEEAMMIGDDYDKDIAPVKILGMQSFWIRRGENGLKDVVL